MRLTRGVVENAVNALNDKSRYEYQLLSANGKHWVMDSSSCWMICGGSLRQVYNCLKAIHTFINSEDYVCEKETLCAR